MDDDRELRVTSGAIIGVVMLLLAMMPKDIRRDFVSRLHEMNIAEAQEESNQVVATREATENDDLMQATTASASSGEVINDPHVLGCMGIEEEIKLRQEAKGLGLTRPLPHTDRSAMLRAVEQSKGEDLGEREQPSSEYIALLLEEIEQDEVTAHTLDEVTSRKDSQTLQLQSSLDQSGRVRITRQEPKGKLPTTTEDLRQKLKLEAHAWLMIAAKMRNKVYLRGLEEKHFDLYTDYVLGDKCYQLLVPGPSGEKQLSTLRGISCGLYEYELRKRAIRKAHKEGRALHITLKEATEDTELKELHFTSPVTFAAMERPAKSPKWDQE